MYQVSLNHVSKIFRGKRGGFITALDDVSLSVNEGQIHAIVGESGSGKSTIGRMTAGLVRPSKGEIMVGGTEIRKIPEKDLFKQAQYIHQDPYGSLDPYTPVQEVLSRPLRYLLGIKSGPEQMKIILEYMEKMRLNTDYLNKTIQELSGGERQRVLVARAFIVNPRYVAADEPTTMIDFISRQEVMQMILDLRKQYNTAILFITHDLLVAGKVAEDLSVMYRGKVVETGKGSTILGKPLHPYTQLLMEVAPENLAKGIIPAREMQKAATAEHVTMIKGCKYAPVCPFAMKICSEVDPELKTVDGRMVSCHLY